MPRHFVRALLIAIVASSAAAQAVSVHKGDVLVAMSGFTTAPYTAVYDADGNLRGFAPPDASGVDLRSFGYDTESVPLRSGAVVIGQSHAVYPYLARYEPSTGKLTTYALPYEPGVIGVRSLDVFADQCTVAWTAWFSDMSMDLTDARLHAIRMYDICRDRPLPDLLLDPTMGPSPQFVRQLPNGDILVVTRTQIGRYDQFGKRGVIIGGFLNNELRGMALTPDGSAFWSVDRSRMVRINLVARDAAPVMVDLVKETAGVLSSGPFAGDVDVAGEWRASLQPPPPPPPSRRRAVTH
jgi:hypothetical protein